MSKLIWLVPAFPLLGVLINGLVVTRSREASKRYSGIIATLCVAVSFVVACVLALNFHAILNGRDWVDSIAYDWITAGPVSSGALNVPLALRLDGLSLTMMLVVTGVGSLIHLFSIGYMAEDERVGRYFTFLNLFTFAMLILVLANNYVLTFVGWEGVGLCSYLLIGFWFEKVTAAQAGKKAFIVNRVGDFGFLLATFALFRYTGSLVFNTPDHAGALDKAGLLYNLHLLNYPAVTVICLLFLLGVTGKSAQLPLYVWLPDAMEGPTPVSALIHAATMVTAGVYLIARSAPLFGQSPTAQAVVAWIGIITALYSAIIALKQYDIKRVLAYSTISQIGYMVVGVGLGAYAAGISHLVTHAFFKALLFLGAGAVMHSLEGQLDMRKMGGVAKYLPVTYFTFAVAWLAISGIPPFSGFVSKDMILDAAFEQHQAAIGWLGIFTAGLTAFYMSRLFFTVFLGSERIEMGDEGHGGNAQEHGHAHTHDHDHDHGHDHGHAHVHPEIGVMNFPLIVLAILSFAGGAVAWVLPGLLERVTVGMTPHEAGAAAEGLRGFNFGLTSIYAIAAGVIGIVAALAMRQQFAQGWSASAERALGALQNAYEGVLHGVFVRGGTVLSDALYSIVDRLMIDRFVELVGGFVNYLAESLRTLQTGYVRNYALVMLAGAVFVVACFMLILQQTFHFTDPRSILILVAVIVALVVVFVIVQKVWEETPAEATPGEQHGHS